MKTKEQFDAKFSDLFRVQRALEAALGALVADPDGWHSEDEWSSVQNEDAAIVIAELLTKNRFQIARLVIEQRDEAREARKETDTNEGKTQ